MLQEPFPISAFPATTEHQARNSHSKQQSCCGFQVIQGCSENRTKSPFAEIASQWNSVQRQDFFQRSAIDECQRVQAVNAGNLIFVFDVVQTARGNHKRRSDAVSQWPDSLREPHAMTIRVAHGLPAVLRRVLIVDVSIRYAL